MEDAEIISLFFQRDERAIAETAKKYGAACMRHALRILPTKEDAEECVNDLYMQLWSTIPPTRPEHFSAYLLTILRHVAMNRARSLSAGKRGGGELRVAMEELDRILPSDEDVTAQAERSITAEAINRFLEGLPKQQRIMFMRRYFHFEPAKEIAAAMQLPEGSVRVTLMRLRTKLKYFLEKEALI